MKTIRERMERSFELLVHGIFKYRWFVLIGSLVLISSLAINIIYLKVDTSTEAFFFEDDPEMITYDNFREQFGSAEVAVIAIRAPDVFTTEFMKKLRSFHQELEKNVPYLDDITSLVNVTKTEGEKDELIIEELMDKWPEDSDKLPEYIESVKRYAAENQLYRNYILSEDHQYTAIVLKPAAYIVNDDQVSFGDGFDTASGDSLGAAFSDNEKKGNDDRQKLRDEETAIFVEALYAISKQYHSDDFSIFIAGQPLLTYSIHTRMQTDVPRFLVLSVVIIVLLLFFLFRRISGVLLPLLIVVLSMVSTLALFAIFNRPFSVITQIIPSFIIAVGIGYSVHILAIFYRQYSVDNDKESALAYAMGHSALAILMTSLTTAGGLLSFAGAKIAPIADLGIFAAAGVMLAFIYTIILLPALIAVFPIRHKTEIERGIEGFFDRILIGMANFSTNKPWLVIASTIMIIIASFVGIAKLHFSHNPVNWFPEDEPFRISTAEIDKGMKGCMTMEAIVETEMENAFFNPDMMHRLEAFSLNAEKLTSSTLFVGKSISVADTLKQINKALNENRQSEYIIPKKKKLIAQEFLLFENGGTDDLENLVNNTYSMARITIKLPWADANAYTVIQERLKNLLEATFDGVGKVTITGMVSLLSHTIYNVIVTMMNSYMIAGVVITFMMIVFIGSFKHGLLSMIPNVLPVVIALGLMGYAGMNLDLSNILIGSIVIGLAVDDTVHFFHNFRRYYAQTGCVNTSVKETLLTTGRAMLFTTLVLFSAFIIFIVSEMNNLSNFGVITGFALVVALLADFFLAPALMAILYGYKEKRCSKHFANHNGSVQSIDYDQSHLRIRSR